MIQLRPYQSEALKKILTRWKEGVTRQLVSLPVGSGKTVLFGAVAEALRCRTLVLAHREELLLQARSKMRLVYGGADIGILKAEERSGLVTDICVASVQTAARRTEALKDRGFRLLIVDEAHHAVSPSYMKIFEELGFMGGGPDKLLLGVTATAYRGDGAGLGAVFEEIVFERSILAMMRAGYLSDIRGVEIRTGTDLSGVHTRQGDFAIEELSAVIDTPARNNLAADAYLEHGEGRRGVVFGVRVEHAINLAEAFKARGVPCEAVWGDMPPERRREALRLYEAGELKLLCNVGILTEGWDVPETDLIMMGRPTKSRGLFIQCVGRGLRLAPGKRDCLLIDLVDTANKHKLCSFGTLAGGIKPTKRRQSLLEAVEEAERLDILREKKRTERAAFEAANIELFERSKFVWAAVERHYKMGLPDGSALWCRYVPGGYSPVLFDGKDAKVLSEDVLPLGYAMGVCEDYARQSEIAQAAMKDAKWRQDAATEKQLAALRRMRAEFGPNITKGEAARLLDEKWGGAPSGNQIWYIRRHHLHPNPEMLSKKQAGLLIDGHKKRGAAAAGAGKPF